VEVTTKVEKAMATIITKVDMEGITEEIATHSNSSNLSMGGIMIHGTTLTMVVVVVGMDRTTMGRHRRTPVGKE
jgi:hypothetical protein